MLKVDKHQRRADVSKLHRSAQFANTDANCEFSIVDRLIETLLDRVVTPTTYEVGDARFSAKYHHECFAGRG